MADIKIKDLEDRNISGVDLFNDDSENFMIELSDESEQVIGGIMMTTTACVDPTCAGETQCGRHSDILFAV